MALGIKAVIFDIDGTLFDRDLAQEMAAENIARKLPHVFHRFNIKRVVESFLESDRLSVADFEAGLPSEGMRDKRTRVFLRLLGAEETDADAITEMYVRDYPTINSPIDGAVPVVKALSTRFPLGCISNGLTDVQYRKLETIGIREAFSCIVLSEEIGIRKPDPRIFRHAADILRIPPVECLYVGDSYSNDVVGAKAAGMQACWYDGGSIAREGSDTKADFVINSLGQLREVLADP